MPKGPQGQKRPGEVIGAAVHVAKIATVELEEDIGPGQDHHREGGKKGGAARADA